MAEKSDLFYIKLLCYDQIPHNQCHQCLMMKLLGIEVVEGFSEYSLSAEIYKQVSLQVQWNLSWETIAMRVHLYWCTEYCSRSHILMQLNLSPKATCLEKLRDHIFMENRIVVFQDRFYCTTYWVWEWWSDRSRWPEAASVILFAQCQELLWKQKKKKKTLWNVTYSKVEGNLQYTYKRTAVWHFCEQIHGYILTSNTKLQRNVYH